VGLFSRKKKAQASFHIQGFPGHVDTCKCLYLAAEKGVAVEAALLDLTGREHEADAFLALSPFGKIPCLDDGDLVISGAAAILPYLDIKGGRSLAPKKAANLGDQDYWIEVGQSQVLPHVNILLDEQILKPMSAPAYRPDQEKIDVAVAEIDQVFYFVDTHLENKGYFAGSFTFADIHWVPYLHFCEITGHGDLLAKRPHLKRWFDQIKSRKNGAQSTYAVLPSLDQIKGKDLEYVA